MKLHIIGSSSRGNAYALEGRKEILLIEAGCRMALVNQAINWQIEKVVGCVVSHEHGDHMGHVKEYGGLGFPVYAPPAAAEKARKDRCMEIHTVECVDGIPVESIRLGEFLISPFDVPHDGTQCFGYEIQHPELGNLVFLTDFQYCPYIFRHHNLHHILVEANYSRDCLNLDKPNVQHVIEGHAELSTTVGFIRENVTDNLRNVVLLHLSDSNSNEKDFVEAVQKVVPAGVSVHVATPGKTIHLYKDVF